MAKQSLETIKNWFKTSFKPTQQQFWDTWDSFWHKDDKIPTSSIENLDVRFDEKADAELLNAHFGDLQAHGINNKVDKEAGKGLSSNDYTTAEKEKLSGIQEAATANEDDDYLLNRANHTGVQEISTVNGLESALATKANLVDGKVPTNQLPAYVDDVLEYADLAGFPKTGEISKIYITTDNNKTYRWGGTAYVAIGSDLALGETASTAYRGDNGKTAYDHSQLSSGNPHQVSKTDVGLSEVDNTSDADKPTSDATILLLADKADLVDGKVPASQLPEGNGNGVSLGETSTTAYRGDYGKTAYDHSQLTSGNPHQVTKADVGLSNVDNTSDADKLISTATNAAFVRKVSKGGDADNTSLTIGTLDNNSLEFVTNKAKRGIITEVGNMGLGTPAPMAKLHVNGSGAFGNAVTSGSSVRALNLIADNAAMRILRTGQYGPIVELIARATADGANVSWWDMYIEVTDKSFRFRNRTDGDIDRLTISSSGNIGIGTITPAAKLDVIGHVIASAATSDNHVVIKSQLDSSLTTKADLVDGKVPASQLPDGGGNGVVLGETSTTAYWGDLGKIAYDHSQLTSGNPHQVNKIAVGLGNVDNTSDVDKPVSKATQNLVSLKFDKSGGKITGNVYLDPSVNIHFSNPNGTGSTFLSENPTSNGLSYLKLPAMTGGEDAVLAKASELASKANANGSNATGTWAIGTTGNASTATKLQTARTINGVAFDGTTNITVSDATREPLVTSGTVAQYRRGDKTWQTLDKTAVGLTYLDDSKIKQWQVYYSYFQKSQQLMSNPAFLSNIYTTYFGTSTNASNLNPDLNCFLRVSVTSAATQLGTYLNRHKGYILPTLDVSYNNATNFWSYGFWYYVPGSTYSPISFYNGPEFVGDNVLVDFTFLCHETVTAKTIELWGGSSEKTGLTLLATTPWVGNFKNVSWSGDFLAYRFYGIKIIGHNSSTSTSDNAIYLTRASILALKPITNLTVTKSVFE